MDTQDASTEFLIKFWPWFEANRKRLVYIAVGTVVVLFICYFVSTQRQQKAIKAGEAYTQLQMSLPPSSSAQQVVDAYRKIAADYPGTLAAGRAQLQAAGVLFNASRYDDALTQFQKILDADKNGELAPIAQLGVAASLEAENKLDAAATKYLAVTTLYPNSSELVPATFAMARVLESQGKLKEATSYYQEVARSPVAGTLAQESIRRLTQIQAQLAAVKPAAKS